MADNFVYDNLPLPETKSDRGDLPDGVPTSQAIRALDFNRVSRYLGDLRDVVGAIAVDPSSAAPVLATGTTTARTLATRFAEVFNVKDFGAKGDDFTNDTAAVLAATAAAVAAGRGVVRFPSGTYRISQSVVAATSGVGFLGDGPGATTVKAISGFSGTALFILGNKSTTAVTTNMSMQGFTLDSASVAGVSGLEAYGLRDGSDFSRIYVTGLASAPGIITGQAGAGAGSSTGRMCEGVQFRNCHVVTFGDMQNTEFWRLDGIFESQLIGCKALGSGSANTFGSTGFRVGLYAEARGLVLMGCSVGNLAGASGGNVGIRYGDWARESWDEFSTFENVLGSAVYFHGSSTSGSLLPFMCRSLHPRLFNSATAGLLDPAFKFGDAQYCHVGPLAGYNTAKVWARFDALVGSQLHNTAEVRSGGVAPGSVSGGIVSFDAASDSSNLVAGYGSGTAGRSFLVSRLGFSQQMPSGRVAPTFAGTVAINAAAGDFFDVSASNGGAFTMGNPTNPTTGQRITIRIKNTYTGALGTLTWGGSYKTGAAWVQPAVGFSRSAEFRYDGTSWVEVGRTDADVPN